MANGSYGKCAGCGEMVIWVKTQAGKNMPCNPTLHNYKIDPTGKEKIVTQTGKVVTGGNRSGCTIGGWIWLHITLCNVQKCK